ncbi:hypothetical protein E4T56_gene8059 [Termitomyces sp. T112]|nr:hypothetical protein E4T56_gene8059 [Termitomyces sp. T112]
MTRSVHCPGIPHSSFGEIHNSETQKLNIIVYLELETDVELPAQNDGVDPDEQGLDPDDFLTASVSAIRDLQRLNRNPR